MTTSGFHALTLVDKTREYDEVYTLRFQPAEPIPFVPGQYVHLLAPASPPGRENVRHLSIASIPEEGPLRFTVDLAPTSDYKKKLAALQPGGLAHLFKVKGHFVLDDPLPTNAIFLAGGIGITPVRALIRQIEAGRLPVSWRLGHVARNSYLYENELKNLGGSQKRIRHEGLEALVDDWSSVVGARWYVAGSSRFVSAVSAMLRERRIVESDVRVEDFE